MRACTIEGCNAKHQGRGLCLKHYNAFYYNKIRPEPKIRIKQVPLCHPELSLMGHGLCGKCYFRDYTIKNKEKLSERRRQRDRTEYYKQKHREWRKTEAGLQYHRWYLANRRHRLSQAMPKWVDIATIKQIYYSCPKGMEVDHIIPITNEIVCGLHVPWNLQYLTTIENRKKSNKVLL